MFTLRQKVGWFALYSRLLIIVLSTFFNAVIQDHDAGVFLTPEDSQVSKSFADIIVAWLFGGLVRWDAHYFLHIASYGYTYEHCLAFFPLYPMFIRIVAGVIHYPLQHLFTLTSMTLLSAISINVGCFVWSAKSLFDLSLHVLKSKDLAYKAALLFCMNPASIFFSAPYSEAMFAYLTFYGMLKVERKRLFDGAVLFGLAGATRSNGLLNIGYLAYSQCQDVVTLSLSTYHSKAHSAIQKCSSCLWVLIRSFLILSVAVFISLAPFIAFQAYGFYKYCFSSEVQLPEFLLLHAKNNDFVLPGSNVAANVTGHWCKNTVPLAYSYIQSYYWNVGFLRYFEWKQIPNFILAFPLVLIILSQSIRFVRQHSEDCISLCLLREHGQASGVSMNRVKGEVIFSPGMFVYVVHAACLTVFCFLCIHVQVTTRLLASASPVLYWFAAYFFFPSGNKGQNEYSALNSQFRKISNVKYTKEFESRIEPVEHLYSRWRVNILAQNPPNKNSTFVVFYFLLYYLLGSIMFSNFLPWT